MLAVHILLWNLWLVLKVFEKKTYSIDDELWWTVEPVVIVCSGKQSLKKCV